MSDDDLTDWERLQILAVYHELEKLYTKTVTDSAREGLLKRIATTHVRERREQ